MNPSTNFVQGKTSRSLKAAYIVSKEGLAPGVGHIEGGIVAWCDSAGFSFPCPVYAMIQLAETCVP